MKTSILPILVSISALALAQDLAGLPACAQTAALNGAAGSGCNLSDAECFCKNSGFIDSLKAAIGTACTSADDQQAACSWGNSACSSYGVTIPCSDTPAATPSDSIPPTTTPAASDSAATGGTDAGTIDAAGSTTTTMPGSIISDTMMSFMTSMTSSMSSMMNETHTAGNSTHSGPHKPSTTSAGPTSQYTGAGNAAVRQSGVMGTVFGVTLLFAFF